MGKQSHLDIDVKNCSEQALVEIIRQLRGSEYLPQQIAAQKELVCRLKLKKRMTTGQIVSVLTQGRTKAEMAEVAAEWADALEITAQQFKRLASGK